LVAGAGQVAARKIERLLASGAAVQVVAREACAPVRELAETGKLSLSLRAVEDADAQGKFLVIAATDDAQANARLAQAARASGALVARADALDDSDFSLPALARSQHLLAALSSHGGAPSASRRLASELTRWLAQGPERFAAEITRVRRALRGQPDAAQRLRELADGPLFEACQRADEPAIAALVADALEARGSGREPHQDQAPASQRGDGE
jgi:uroporphyrin-III C-methyltransferase/precorrin-2 dehydrogenase/sirohydrochlorin ferrochelatase